MDEAIKILCVDDEKNVLRALQRLFMDEDYELLTATDGEEGLEVLQQESGIQLVLSDYRMPGMDGVEFLKNVYERNPEIIRIVLSGYADTASVVAAINEGKIYKFIPKPWNDDELRVTISKALEYFFLKEKNEKLADELMGYNDELQRINNSLEDEVQRRTAELLFKNKALSFSHNVMDFLPVAVVGLDLDGLIVLSNKEADTLLGKGSSLAGAYKATLPEEAQKLIKELQGEKSVEGVVDLDQKTFTLNVVKFLGDEGQEGIILIFIPNI